MVANKEKLRSFLETKKLTDQDFAQLLGVEQSEADKLLAGERVGYDTAKKFIYFFKGEVAQHYIDWDSTGVENPLGKKVKGETAAQTKSCEKTNYEEEVA